MHLCICTAHDFPPFNCRSDQFRCFDNHQCVAKERVCDGRVDCFDQSDENLALCGKLKLSILISDCIAEKFHGRKLFFAKPSYMYLE